jgi:hypothetical protein
MAYIYRIRSQLLGPSDAENAALSNCCESDSPWSEPSAVRHVRTQRCTLSLACRTDIARHQKELNAARPAPERTNDTTKRTPVAFVSFADYGCESKEA